jgi:shikimate kinase
MLKHICFIGNPGSGKSFLGKQLADALAMQFIDIDILLEQRYQRPLHDILQAIGPESFIEEEAEVVTQLPLDVPVVISPGGSIVYSPEAMNFLQNNTKIIFLNVPIEKSLDRIDVSSRGIVVPEGKDLSGALLERQQLYKKYAQYTFDDTCTVQNILRVIT